MQVLLWFLYASAAGNDAAASFEGALDWPDYMAAVGSRLAAVAAVDDGLWHGAAADDPLSVMDAAAAGDGGAPSGRQSASGEQMVLPNLPLSWRSGQSSGCQASKPERKPMLANPGGRNSAQTLSLDEHDAIARY
jgi:hypothetical protein